MSQAAAERVPAGPQLVHLPDLQFASWCYEHYGLNKGVYNTIDERLFAAGLIEITSRRAALLSFLDQATHRGIRMRDGKFLRFGKGGLTVLLEHFLQGGRA
ncbi:MAG: hypothetical protein J7639_30075 [Paenibacillaceae bacterium]|nr:hypothetical protein [Paenibacillaceae bacterium]